MYNQSHVGISEAGPGRVTKDLPTAITLGAEPTAISGEQAQTMLEEIGATIKELGRKELECRLELGRLLIAIQDRLLWGEMAPSYATWTDFLEKGFTKITGLHISSAYVAVQLAKSRALKEIPPVDLAKIPLSNAKTLVQLEKATPRRRPSAEVIEKAKTLTNSEFRREVGVSRGYNVQVWAPDKAAGRQLQRIAENFRHVTEDAARAFANFLGSVDVTKRAGDGIDNKTDLIVATCQLAWQNEEAEMELAASEAFGDPFMGKQRSPNLETKSTEESIGAEWSGEEQSPVVADS